MCQRLSRFGSRGFALGLVIHDGESVPVHDLVNYSINDRAQSYVLDKYATRRSGAKTCPFEETTTDLETRNWARHKWFVYYSVAGPPEDPLVSSPDHVPQMRADKAVLEPRGCQCQEFLCALPELAQNFERASFTSRLLIEEPRTQSSPTHSRNHGHRVDCPVGARFPKAAAHFPQPQGEGCKEQESRKGRQKMV